MLDDRIAVAAPCVYATDLAALVERGHAGCCAYVPNHALAGEVEDVHAAIAPRKLLVLSAGKDRELCTRQSQITAAAAEAFKFYDLSFFASFCDPDSGHDYNQAMRERFYAWCARWLDGRTDIGDRVPEPPSVATEIVPKNDPRLIVFKNASERGVPLTEINRRIAGARRATWIEPPKRPEDVRSYRERLVAQLRPLMGDFAPEPGPATVLAQRAGQDPSSRFTEYVVSSDPDMPITVIRCHHQGDPRWKAAVLLLDFGSFVNGHEACRSVSSFLEAGCEVFRVYPRSTGAGVPTREDPDLYAMALARPTMAGRVHDVRSARRFIESLRPTGDTCPMILLARGEEACSVASYCALLDRYDHVLLERPIAGWQRYLDRAVRPRYAAILPLQLKVCDLPQMWAALAPGRLTLVNLRDVGGAVLPARARTAAIRTGVNAYRLTEHPDRFTYLEEMPDTENVICAD
jgi:hypothetical protein